jgi:site-specific DNA-methyltransferase (adenine-specific)
MNQIAVQSYQQDFTYASFRLQAEKLLAVGNPTREQWRACGRFLRLAEGNIHFWIGDWLIYGQAHFKEDYDEAIDLTGYSYHTLRKDKYIAERIPPERRRPTVDVAIHQEVAPLPPQVQEKLLQRAEDEQLSVQQLRMEKHRYLYEVARNPPVMTTPDTHLYLGECIEIMENLPNESVDCILTDPPYGVSYQSEHRTLPFEKIVNDDLEKAKKVLDRALEVAQKKLRTNSHVYIFSTWRTYPQMAEIVSKYFQIKNLLVWVKNNWTPGDLEGNYGHQHEFIIFAHKGRRHLFGKRDPNVLHFDRVGTNALQHPTEKPVKLLEYLIQKSTAAGETVLDMFMGSGSTCLAAKHTKRNYIGIEIDKKWYAVAQKRLA